MIIDTLTAAAENELYPPVIRQALQAVLQQQPHALPPGKYTVESDNVFLPSSKAIPGRWASNVRNIIVNISIFTLC